MPWTFAGAFWMILPSRLKFEVLNVTDGMFVFTNCLRGSCTTMICSSRACLLRKQIKRLSSRFGWLLWSSYLEFNLSVGSPKQKMRIVEMLSLSLLTNGKAYLFLTSRRWSALVPIQPFKQVVTTVEGLKQLGSVGQITDSGRQNEVPSNTLKEKTSKREWECKHGRPCAKDVLKEQVRQQRLSGITPIASSELRQHWLSGKDGAG